MTGFRPRAVVLLSGGLDSATVLAIAQGQGFEVYALTFDYGQRHVSEISCATETAKHFKVQRHSIIRVNLREFGGSVLTSEGDVPKNRRAEEMAAAIPSTYVPARNTIFLSFALAFAEVVGANDIFAGMNAQDFSGYPDCRPEYIAAFEAMANLATKMTTEGRQRIRVHAPLMHFSKGEIVKRGLVLGVDYSLTNSCYDPAPSGEACACCDACILRLEGFAQNGIADPIKYRALAGAQ